MYIVSGSKVANIKEKQIDAPIQKLYIKGSIPVDANGSSNMGKSLLNELNKMKISLQKQTTNGNKQILLPIGMGSVAEICANAEGHINSKYSSYWKSFDFELTIELSSHGAINSTQGEFLLLSIDTVDSLCSNLDVYGVEIPVITDSYNKYEQLRVQANTTKSINLLGKELLALPRDGFFQIDLVFADRTTSYKQDIKAIPQAIENMILNHVTVDTDMGAGSIASSYAQTYFDGVAYYTIGVANCIEAKVTYTTEATIITVESV